MINKVIFHAKNTDIIANLNEAANRITEQEEIINHLREKIEINPAEPRYLKVVWGRGYKMEGDSDETK